ncbi:MAG: magnesium/cobalt transporter CorA [Bacteroidota bacterium]
MIHRIRPDVHLPISIKAFQYQKGAYTETEGLNIASLSDALSQAGISWINVDGLHQPELIQQLGEVLHIHQLTREDILNPEQRPKAEEFDAYLLVVINMLYPDPSPKGIALEQISFLLGPTFVISFQEHPADVFEEVRKRIRNPTARIHQHKADYLLYLLMDAVIDHYYAVIDQIEDQVEELEEQIQQGLSAFDLTAIQQEKRELIQLRKSVYPMREVLNHLTHPDRKLIQPKTQRFFKDLQEKVHQVMEGIDTQRDLLSSLQDLHLALQGQKMNEIMKVLTIISTLFIPLTFLAGIYGMNFDYMPETKWEGGYFGVLGVMLIIGIALLIFFRRKKWL